MSRWASTSWRCHHLSDRGELDPLLHLEPDFRAEVEHALYHLSLVAALWRLSGRCWLPS